MAVRLARVRNQESAARAHAGRNVVDVLIAPSPIIMRSLVFALGVVRSIKPAAAVGPGFLLPRFNAHGALGRE